VVVDQFARVTSLVDPATRLLRPSIMWRVARANQRRRRHEPDEVRVVAESALH
jgi:hypothetical protein